MWNLHWACLKARFLNRFIHVSSYGKYCINGAKNVRSFCEMIQFSLYRGAALPKNTPAVPCIFDPLGRAGICGDWLLGSNLESAALSGEALGNHVRSFL